MSAPRRKLAAPAPASEQPPNMLNEAIEYAKQGWRIFPCHTPLPSGGCSCRKATCDSIGKHPRTANGLVDATTDTSMIRKWWTKWPNANIAIATGEASFVVLDVDLPEGPASLAKLEKEYGPLPETLEARTGSGGRHLCFAHPGVKIGNVNPHVKGNDKLGKKLDVRGDGGYIVVHPSLHHTGNRYGQLNGALLAPMPQWLVEALTNKTSKTPGATASPANGRQSDVILEGERNQTLVSLAGTMRHRGMSVEAMKDSDRFHRLSLGKHLEPNVRFSGEPTQLTKEARSWRVRCKRLLCGASPEQFRIGKSLLIILPPDEWPHIEIT